jgi:hypothetical protein
MPDYPFQYCKIQFQPVAISDGVLKDPIVTAGNESCVLKDFLIVPESMPV